MLSCLFLVTFYAEVLRDSGVLGPPPTNHPLLPQPNFPQSQNGLIIYKVLSFLGKYCKTLRGSPLRWATGCVLDRARKMSTVLCLFLLCTNIIGHLLGGPLLLRGPRQFSGSSVLLRRSWLNLITFLLFIYFLNKRITKATKSQSVETVKSLPSESSPDSFYWTSTQKASHRNALTE